VTLLGILGILLGLVAWPFAFIKRTRGRAAVFALAFLSHALCAVIYYIYVQTTPADTALYYNDPGDRYAEGFGSSTQFIVFVVQSIKAVFGGSYLDYFFLFQAFGFWGIALLMRTLEEIYAGLDLPQPTWSYLLLFLPGIHFWTSAIGKDAPLFTACCLALWGVMQVRRRYVALGVAIIVMVMIRPHIALITVAAISWTVFGDRTTHPVLRGLLIVGSVSAIALAAALLRSTYQLDVTSADSVSDYLAQRSSFQTTTDVGNTAVLNAAYPVRVLSFLFRPLFLDAAGAFGYIASIENVILLFLFGGLALRVRVLIAAAKGVPFVRYALISSVGITLALAIDYYNVGLGLRQKTMVVPDVIVLFVAVAALRLARRRNAQIAEVVRASPLAA
jgi:hypothetical protein